MPKSHRSWCWWGKLRGMASYGVVTPFGITVGFLRPMHGGNRSGKRAGPRHRRERTPRVVRPADWLDPETERVLTELDERAWAVDPGLGSSPRLMTSVIEAIAEPVQVPDP